MTKQDVKAELGEELVSSYNGHDLLKISKKLLTKYAIPTKDVIIFLKHHFNFICYDVLIEYIVKLARYSFCHC